MREPKKRFIIFCEGEKTEPAYFRAIKHHIQDALVEVKTEAGVGVPRTIANAAILEARRLGLSRRSRKPKNSFEERDEVWAVFDRESYCRILVTA